MSGNAEEPDESHCAWKGKTEEKLDQARDSKDKVKKALLDLEKKHEDKVAAIEAERRRQARLAAEAAARAKREQEMKVQAEFKRQQAANLQAKKDAVKQGKRDEANALKAATANFLASRRAENLMVMRASRIFEMERSLGELQNSQLACFKQYRMWYSAVTTCEMRLQAREERPQSELINDHVQVALERELTTLRDARAVLKGLVDESERLSAEMADTRKLLKSGCSRENVMDRSMRMHDSSSMPHLPAINPAPNSPKNFVRSLTMKNETPTQEDLLDRATEQTKRAFVLSDECENVLENCRKNCNKAIAASNAALDQRKEEIEEVRRKLEAERLDAEGSIKDASARLTMLKMRGSHHPQTQEELDELQMGEDLIKELQEQKAVLTEDWRCKSHAFHIDGFCRNLTSTRAATLKKVPANPNESPEHTASFE